MTDRNPSPATGRVAIVTGGGSGLGLATARRLLKLGYRVHALGKDQEETVADPRFAFHDFDVTDATAAARFAASFDGLDALVNAAGIISHDGGEFTPDGFRKVMDVNVAGMHIVSTALQVALAARRGAVVNFSSMWGIFGSPRNPAYAASKGAVTQLTRSLAVAWANDGVRVNAVAPGWIATRMSARAMSDPVRSQAIVQRIPMARWGEPDEVAGVVCFLLSDEARYVTGAVIPVDGGYSIA